jgi:hypothetical protein
MTETPEQRVARLEAELAQARVDALETQLGQARAAAGLAPDQPALTRRTGPTRRGSFHKTAAPATDDRLAPPPRSVPSGYRLVVLPFSWWSVFAMFMVSTAPIALWIGFPLGGVIAAVLTAVTVAGLQVRKAWRRSALLRWGQVARVTGTDVLSRGTYYSGTTAQNVRMAQAHGWQVERRWYSGPVTRTRISYELNGRAGSIVLRGLEYDYGVVLADSREPRRALCISSFPYDLDRDAAGNWTGAVATRVKVGSLLMALFLISWTGGMCWLWGATAAG